MGPQNFLFAYPLRCILKISTLYCFFRFLKFVHAIYLNNENYQKIYLKVLNLDKSYLINGYEMDIKILTEKKKIIDYIKE